VTLVSDLQAVVTAVLTDYGEAMRVSSESAITYDGSGIATIARENPQSAPTFLGSPWETVSGATLHKEAGRESKSSAQFICVQGVTILPDDRIYRADNTWKYVNYVDPIGLSGSVVGQTVYLKDTRGNQ
jgi:hypothetical protein